MSSRSTAKHLFYPVLEAYNDALALIQHDLAGTEARMPDGGVRMLKRASLLL